MFVVQAQAVYLSTETAILKLKITNKCFVSALFRCHPKHLVYLVVLRPSSVKLVYCLHFTAVFNVCYIFLITVTIHYAMICFIKIYA